MFIVNVPVGLASLIAGWRILREVRHPEAERPDFLGASLLTAGMATLVVAIIQGSTWGWASESRTMRRGSRADPRFSRAISTRSSSTTAA